MDDYKTPHFGLPTRSKEELFRQADLYRRLAAAVSDKAKAERLTNLAHNYEAMANAAKE